MLILCLHVCFINYACLTCLVVTMTESVLGKPDDDLSAAAEKLGASRLPFPQLLEHIGAILGFVWSELFLSLEDISSCAGGHLAHSPIQLNSRLSECLVEFIPKGESELLVFQNLIQQSCVEYEVRMNNYGFMSTQSTRATHTSGAVRASGGESSSVTAAQGNDTPLTDIVNTLKSRYAKSRRSEILVRAREVLLADYHNTMLASGDASEVSE